MMKAYSKSVIALELPGIGVIESQESNENKYPFSCIELSKKQLLLLLHEITKELLNGKENNLE
jgi:hypothetical protein